MILITWSKRTTSMRFLLALVRYNHLLTHGPGGVQTAFIDLQGPVTRPLGDRPPVAPPLGDRGACRPVAGRQAPGGLLCKISMFLAPEILQKNPVALSLGDRGPVAQ